MQPTLFSYIWRFSARQQLMLLAITIASFPILYVTLEIPKRIVNDAIDASAGPIEAFGFTFTQIEYLAFLCAIFLAFVLLSGVVKMQLNTYKGVVAERLLRRFRYQLIHRILRFPLPHFRRTSQGELISMVTSEAEPLGGVMGDAIAQPVFQAGQMLTILTFLFVQNVWFGLAAVALIPLQAYVIPLLQRRINTLNIERVREVRKLAETIGESVAGVEDLRSNNGVRFALADFTARLGRLFRIRYEIYRRKFFMKFLNNFINQLTPFFFFAIGGYLAIQGELTVGALVAALAAYKDLSAPWKELLTYYTQVQDMSLRYKTIIEQFGPRGLIDESLFDGRPDEIPRLTGPIKLNSVSVTDPNGSSILNGLDVEIPGGAMVAVKSESSSERRALAQLLSRGVAPSSGRVELSGRPLAEMHQAVVAARVGVAGGGPYLFNRSIEDNVKMALRQEPQLNGAVANMLSAEIDEAITVGNSPDPLDAEWLDHDIIGVNSTQELNDWWLSIIRAIGTEDYLFLNCLMRPMNVERHPDLAKTIVGLRPKIAERLAQAALSTAVYPFDDEHFNPGLDLASNLLFATPRRRVAPETMAADPRFLETIRELDIEEQLLALSDDVLSVLMQTFGETGSAHPLFQRFSKLDAAHYDQLVQICAAANHDSAAMNEADRAMFLTLPFVVAAEQLGEAFPMRLVDDLEGMCRVKRTRLRELAGDQFVPLDPETFAPGLSILENALFGKLSQHAGADADKVIEIVTQVFEEADLKGAVALLIGDVEAGIGGSNLPTYAHERIAFVRAAMKKPDILVLDRALVSHTPEQRREMRRRLRALLPETTIIFLEPAFSTQSEYDVFLEIKDGRLIGDAAAGQTVDEMLSDVKSGSSDLRAKLRVLENVSLFEGLDQEQLRLLAYASRWIKANAGEALFRAGDPPDGAYVLTEGTAELRWPQEDGSPSDLQPITIVEPGRLIGDLSVIRNENRIIELFAVTDIVGLRLGKSELMDIISHDATIAMSLLQTVSGYLTDVASRLRDARDRLPRETV